MTGRLFEFPPTHMLRVDDDRMDPVWREGYWLGVRAGGRPRPGSEWIFTNRSDDSTAPGRVVSCDRDGWRIRQFNPDKVRSLTKSRWRPTWHVRSIHHSRGVDGEWHRARALGDHERAEAILRARYDKGPMPPPLPAGTPSPTLYALSAECPW